MAARGGTLASPAIDLRRPSRPVSHRRISSTSPRTRVVWVASMEVVAASTRCLAASDASRWVLSWLRRMGRRRSAMYHAVSVRSLASSCDSAEARWTSSATWVSRRYSALVPMAFASWTPARSTPTIVGMRISATSLERTRQFASRNRPPVYSPDRVCLGLSVLTDSRYLSPLRAQNLTRLGRMGFLRAG